MAVTELLTGLSCLPWLIYYYTMGGKWFWLLIGLIPLDLGYKTDHVYGLPAFWCKFPSYDR